jgi:hypothetical protein
LEETIGSVLDGVLGWGSGRDPKVGMERYLEALERCRGGRSNCVATALLGISDQHFRRLRDRDQAQGAAVATDPRRRRMFWRPAPVDWIEFVAEWYRTRCGGDIVTCHRPGVQKSVQRPLYSQSP